MSLGVSETITLSVVTVALLAAGSILWTSWRNGIAPTPASPSVMRAVAEEVNRIEGEGLLVEAGAGWGSLGLYLGKHCKGWRVEGVENSPIPLAVSKLAVWLTFGAPKRVTGAVAPRPVSFRMGNIYDLSYREARAVVLYLYPGAMSRLAPMLAEHLSPGARIVSVCFALPGWQPERIVACNDLYRTQIYVYKKA